jgi:hypothetical protein
MWTAEARRRMRQIASLTTRFCKSAHPFTDIGFTYLFISFQDIEIAEISTSVSSISNDDCAPYN